MNFILVNVYLGKAILFFISMSRLASGVIVQPKYLQVPAWMWMVRGLHKINLNHFGNQYPCWARQVLSVFYSEHSLNWNLSVLEGQAEHRA